MKSTVGGGGREMSGSVVSADRRQVQRRTDRDNPQLLIPLRGIRGETRLLTPKCGLTLRCRARWQSAISKADGK
ncbi:MAG: hypothetical protein DME32_16830 [Verrucomicrobia bacterium]|nr:MAG: hypothetical protein DME32_16830 [Verrucomicrobiota bacterium]